MKTDIEMQHVDVIGEAEFEITAKAYRFTLKVKKKSGVSQLDKTSAAQVAQSKIALDSVFSALSDSDIPDDHVRYGGVSDQKEWRRKGYDHYRFTTFVITHDNVNDILALQSDLNELKIGNHVLEYSDFHAIYPKENIEKVEAFAKAMENAKAIATAIVAVTDQSIGKVIHAKDVAVTNSGRQHGDWMGSAVAGAAGGSAALEFQEHKRVKLVKLQVRFALES